jgi:hypothetical protein
MRFSAALSLALLVGCQSGTGDGVHCTTELNTGVFVELSDAVTGAPISGATLTLRDGKQYRETMQEVQSKPTAEYIGATDVAGNFDLSISAEGYDPDTRSGIDVRWDECDLLTQKLQIRLTPMATARPHPVIVVIDNGIEGAETQSWRVWHDSRKTIRD